LKKLILGILIGCALSLTTAAVASNSVQAVIFPSKFFFNGTEKNLSSEYTVLNYKDHVYVPLRFVVESMGGSVIYTPSNDPSVPSQIEAIYATPDPADLTIHDSKNIVSVGKLNILSVPDGARTVVQGQVMLNKSEYASSALTFTINFYDKSGKLVSNESVIRDPIRVGQILPFSFLTIPELQKEIFDHITITDVVVREAANK
jgi:hypothetical protein